MTKTELLKTIQNSDDADSELKSMHMLTDKRVVITRIFYRYDGFSRTDVTERTGITVGLYEDLRDYRIKIPHQDKILASDDPFSPPSPGYLEFQPKDIKMVDNGDYVDVIVRYEEI